MSVYVDNFEGRFGRMVMCHMMADTVAELHAMADRIGVARKWVQVKRSGLHYDICKKKRALAVAAGATEIECRSPKFMEVLKTAQAQAAEILGVEPLKL